MQVVSSTNALSQWVRSCKQESHTIGFVPTMGYLHAGHVSLMEHMRPLVDRLVVSIYVNPLQFGPNEDLERYPRDLEGDTAACKAAGVDVVFTPQTLYPDGFCTSVSVHGLTEVLCGASRPGHFEGVATVVARLFGLVQCDMAIFGEKDFQQLCVLRRMVRDLGLPIQVLGAPIVRDLDGLALSSRNAYLSPEQRNQALSLSRSLFSIRDMFLKGERSVEVLLGQGCRMLQVDQMDYLEIVDAQDLSHLDTVTRPARCLVAGYVGATRLIDNIALDATS